MPNLKNTYSKYKFYVIGAFYKFGTDFLRKYRFMFNTYALSMYIFYL